MLVASGPVRLIEPQGATASDRRAFERMRRKHSVHMRLDGPPADDPRWLTPSRALIHSVWGFISNLHGPL